MPFLLNEDAAVKTKMQGMTVADANAPVGGRPVKVWFRLPEAEMRDVTYPLVAITRTGMDPAHDREHRGTAPLLYTPESVADWNPLVEDPGTSPYVVEYPVPIDITYQITVRARLESHIMAITAQLAQPDRLPYRFGYLQVPQDGTVRSLFVEGGPEYSPARDRDGKRLFSADYVIKVPTELLPSVIAKATTVDEVVLSEIGLLIPTE